MIPYFLVSPRCHDAINCPHRFKGREKWQQKNNKTIQMKTEDDAWYPDADDRTRPEWDPMLARRDYPQEKEYILLTSSSSPRHTTTTHKRSPSSSTFGGGRTGPSRLDEHPSCWGTQTGCGRAAGTCSKSSRRSRSPWGSRGRSGRSRRSCSTCCR